MFNLFDNAKLDIIIDFFIKLRIRFYSSCIVVMSCVLIDCKYDEIIKIHHLIKYHTISELR